MIAIARKHLEPLIGARADADGSLPDGDITEAELAEIMEEIEEEFFSEFTSQRFSSLVRPVAIDTANFQRGQLAKQVKAALGVEPTQSEPWLKEEIANFTKTNVSFIRSIPKQFFADLEAKLAHGISKGLRQEELADIVQERYGVATSRAALIARDQVGKFFGSLNQTRQENLGITSYTWRTAMDNRVREEHEVLEGRAEQWDDPPEDGAPGEAINCRCYAEPNLDEVFSNLGVDTSSVPSDGSAIADYEPSASEDPAEDD